MRGTTRVSESGGGERKPAPNRIATQIPKGGTAKPGVLYSAPPSNKPAPKSGGKRKPALRPAPKPVPRPNDRIGKTIANGPSENGGGRPKKRIHPTRKSSESGGGKPKPTRTRAVNERGGGDKKPSPTTRAKSESGGGRRPAPKSGGRWVMKPKHPEGRATGGGPKPSDVRLARKRNAALTKKQLERKIARRTAAGKKSGAAQRMLEKRKSGVKRTKKKRVSNGSRPYGTRPTEAEMRAQAKKKAVSRDKGLEKLAVSVKPDKRTRAKRS